MLFRCSSSLYVTVLPFVVRFPCPLRSAFRHPRRTPPSSASSLDLQMQSTGSLPRPLPSVRLGSCDFGCYHSSVNAPPSVPCTSFRPCVRLRLIRYGFFGTFVPIVRPRLLRLRVSPSIPWACAFPLLAEILAPVCRFSGFFYPRPVCRVQSVRVSHSASRAWPTETFWGCPVRIAPNDARCVSPEA